MHKRDKKGATESFSSLLLDWNRYKNDRKMPWKGQKDPYKIWLSEIILQQTRVEQGLSYYLRFVENYPDIHQLANASDASIFKLWEGLGYYSRCRNLIATARHISTEKKGKFPDQYEEIKSLKGIGPYTAAAISSFAFNLPHAVVDGNVFRVLSRVFGIDKPIDSTEGKKYFTKLAQHLLDKDHPASYNQAIMDFGAVICKPAAPHCTTCVFNKTCVALLTNRVAALPIKEKKISIRKRWFTYLVIEYKGRVVIRQRTAKDIWQQLYEFPITETIKEEDTKKILAAAEESGWLGKDKYELVSVSPYYKQQLSHQLIVGRFIRIRLTKKPIVMDSAQWVTKEELATYAFPGIINLYFTSKEQQALL